jgi:glycosyltransferase involved in cell wall biosynthesis
VIAASLLASTSRNAGGLFQSVRRLHQELLSLPGVTVPVYGLEDQYTSVDRTRWAPLVVNSCNVLGPKSFGYAPTLISHLMQSQADLLQVHGIWQYPSVAALEWHRRTGRPYLVSPHGMLDPWALHHAGWKKRLAALFYEGRHLRGAACLRALCESEAQSMRAYGLQNPICIIPNGVDLPLPAENGIVSLGRSGSRKKIMLSLGRLHPKKGLPNALRAWSGLCGGNKGTEWQLVIAGWDQGRHEAALKQLCTELGITYAEVPAAEFVDCPAGAGDHASVVFTGPAFGEAKDKLFGMAEAFILPSFSEGLPMAVLEAWGHALPVVMTDQCNLPEGFTAQAAWRTDTSTEGIAEMLRLLLDTPDADRIAMGLNGRKLVRDRFSWPMVASQMKQVYDWVLGGGAPPPSVRLL